MTKTPKQILLDAADLIERNGWTQYSYTNLGGYCAAGALRQATWGSILAFNASDPELDVYSETQHIVQKEINNLPITEWNDHKVQSGEEVIQLFREVAAKL